MVVPQECRRIGASAFVVFDIVLAGVPRNSCRWRRPPPRGTAASTTTVSSMDAHAVAQTAEGRVEAAAPGARGGLARLLARARRAGVGLGVAAALDLGPQGVGQRVHRVAADGSDAAPVAVDDGAAARDGGDAGGMTGGWPTAGFAQRSRGADGNSIDVPAASAAILAAVAVGGVVAAALCLLCFRSGQAAAAPNTAPAAARSAPRSQPCSRSPWCKA